MNKFMGIIISFLFLGTLNAQESQNSDTTFINSLKPGTWSVQFGISSNFTLTNYNGYNISLKRHSTDRQAWRLGIQLYGGTDDRNLKLFDMLNRA